MSGVGWRVAVGGKVQVDDDPHRERTWGRVRESGKETLKATDGGSEGGGGTV